MSSHLEARVNALETILDKYLPNIKNMSSKKKTTVTGGEESPPAPPVTTTIGLKAPFQYDVPYNGIIFRATPETLADNPEIHEYMQKHFPECFV